MAGAGSGGGQPSGRIAEGKPGDIAKIKVGIEAATEYIPTVELNLLLQEQNAHEVDAIIDYARELGTGLQIIELVDTSHNAGLGGGKIASSAIAAKLRAIATSTTAEPVATAACGHSRDPPGRRLGRRSRLRRRSISPTLANWTLPANYAGGPSRVEPLRAARHRRAPRKCCDRIEAGQAVLAA